MQKYIANWNISEFNASKGHIFEEDELKGRHEHFIANGTISVLGEMQVDKIEDLENVVANLKAQNEMIAKERDALALEILRLNEAIAKLETKGKNK